jgi:peptidoglycan/LPS O-acetylase OafA/YrhL
MASAVAVQAARATTRFYHPELDALRLLAFLLVFVWHMAPFTGFPRALTWMGAFGLPIFFLLSAYLIISLLLREREVTGTVKLRYFTLRRILRIWPLYFLALGAAYLLGRIVPLYFVSAHGILAFVFLLGNVWMAPLPEIASPLFVLWSISVEEQFYLVAPSVVKFAGIRTLRIVCWLAIFTAYGVLAFFRFRSASPSHSIWMNSFVQFQFFGAGGLLAIHLRNRRLRIRLWMRAIMAAIGFLAFYIAAGRFGLPMHASSPRTAFLLGYASVLTGGVLIFVSFLDMMQSPIPVITYLGKISYGLYVFHPWALALMFHPSEAPSRHGHLVMGDAAALLLTIGLAILSYEFFEKRVLLFKRHFEVVHSRPL